MILLYCQYEYMALWPFIAQNTKCLIAESSVLFIFRCESSYVAVFGWNDGLGQSISCRNVCSHK